MKTLTQILGTGIAIGILALNPGCTKEEEIYPDYSEPNTQQNTATNNQDSINSEIPYYPTTLARNGDLLSSTNDAFFNTNYIGLANFGMYPVSIYDPDWLIGQNGFELYEGHAGGIGDTFQVLSKQQGIYACWAYGGLDNIVLFGNWKGKVYEGDIRLGDSKNKFLAAFPNARVTDAEPYYDQDFLDKYVRENLVSLSTSFLAREYPQEDIRLRIYYDLIADIGNSQIMSIRIARRFENF